jgi:hypothetical protein
MTIETPKPLEQIDWSRVTKSAQSLVDGVAKNGYTDEDAAQYMFEDVMETIYGKDFWKWYNKIGN